MKQAPKKALVVIRVRGSVNIRKDIKATLRMLRLTRANHCVILPPTADYIGMLQKVKDYITWGEIENETLEMLIKKRARLQSNIPLTEKWLKENTKYSSFKELANALVNCQVKFSEIPIRPIFRLNPPRKGYGGVKRAYKVGGALGDRGKDINDLISRMV
ncbi:MAG: 50S ribosomal protein L30 [Candidatus Thermoplasmatota archaeon]